MKKRLPNGFFLLLYSRNQLPRLYNYLPRLRKCSVRPRINCGCFNQIQFQIQIQTQIEMQMLWALYMFFFLAPKPTDWSTFFSPAVFPALSNTTVLTCLLVRNNRLVLGVPRWATCRVSRHPCPGPMTGQCRRKNPMSRWARWRSWSWAHNLWGRWRRRRHCHSPCWRSSTCFPWRSGCWAQGTARSAGGGRKSRRQGRTGGSGRGKETQRSALMNDYGDVWWQDSDLEPIRCETTSPGVQECALCASSAYGVHHASVCVNAVVLCELHVIVRVHVISLVVHAVIGLTLGLIAHVVVVVFVVAILHRMFCIWRYTLYILHKFPWC